MTLAEVLPLALRLTSMERRSLAEELWLSLDDDPVDPEVLRLVTQRVDHIQQHPEESLAWSDFEKLIEDRSLHERLASEC